MKLFFLIFSYAVGRFVFFYIEKLLIKSNCLKKNFKGVLIPSSVGIIYIINILFLFPFFVTILNLKNDLNFFLLLIGILAMGFVGMIDDLIGNRETTGFKGHIKMLVYGDITTGVLKAIVGGLVSIVISLFLSNNLFEIAINFLLISLFTNFINLLDLRPGRAIKIYLCFAIVFLFLLVNNGEFVIICTIGTSLAYLPKDIKGLAMLGDVGSNSLGIILGITSTFLPIYIKVSLLFFLIITHLYAEKYSISKLILGNRILNYFDNIGR